MTFGADAKDLEHFTYGGNVAWMGAGIVGVEGDFGYTPNFFEPKDSANSNDLVGSNNVTTLMGNVIVGAPIGGQHGPGSGLYASAGLDCSSRTCQEPRTS